VKHPGFRKERVENHWPMQKQIDVLYGWKIWHKNGGLKCNLVHVVPIPQAGTIQASVGEQVFQTDNHDGPRLLALVDCTKKSLLKVRNGFEFCWKTF
jgi:hypothetical protein